MNLRNCKVRGGGGGQGAGRQSSNVNDRLNSEKGPRNNQEMMIMRQSSICRERANRKNIDPAADR